VSRTVEVGSPEADARIPVSTGRVPGWAMSVSYGTGARGLHDASLEIEAGECVALLAANGAMQLDTPKAPRTGRSIVTTAKSSVAPSGSSAVIQMNDHGTLTLLCSTTEMGQGSRTVMTQLAAEGLGARLQDMTILASDTAFTPPDRSTSSRSWSRSPTQKAHPAPRAWAKARPRASPPRSPTPSLMRSAYWCPCACAARRRSR
jgi:hypothetical protein